MKIKLLQWLLLLFLIPADLLFLFGSQKKAIRCDLARIMEELPYKNNGIASFNYAMLINKPFRNIFYYRTSESLILRNLSRFFIKPLNTIEIMGDIKEGMRISHNYCVIHPEKAGKNLFVGHGATIGKGKSNPFNPNQIYPIIGDNVSIFANAVVFGGITIGDNVKIGAGAVVNKSVPENHTAIGNPAVYLCHKSI